MNRAYWRVKARLFYWFTWCMRHTLSADAYEQRCRRFDLGYGWRWLGRDWFAYWPNDPNN